jgi:hypothetical protein
MKRVIISLSVLLIGCSSPDYSRNIAGYETSAEKQDMIELVTLYGMVVGITEDNQIRVDVPDRSFSTSGVDIQQDQIIQVGLAALNIDALEATNQAELQRYLTDRLMGHDVMISLNEYSNPEAISGYISVMGEDTVKSIQQELLNTDFSKIINREEIETYIQKIKNWIPKIN